MCIFSMTVREDITSGYLSYDLGIGYKTFRTKDLLQNS